MAGRNYLFLGANAHAMARILPTAKIYNSDATMAKKSDAIDAYFTLYINDHPTTRWLVNEFRKGF